MIYIKLFLALIMISIIIIDFSLSKGEFIKVKIFHVIAISFMFYFHSSCIDWFYWLINNFSQFNEVFKNDFGIVSSSIIKIDYFILNIISAIVLYLLFGLIKRNDKSRSLLLKVIPFIIIIYTIPIYMGAQSKANGLINDYVLLVIAFGLSLVLHGLIFLIYRTKFMIDFFDNKHLKNNNYAQ